MSARVLFLTCHLPYPPISGGRRREYEILTRLGPRLDIDLVVASKTYDEDVANASALGDVCSDVAVFRCEDPDAEALSAGTAPTQVLRHSCPSLRSFVAEKLDERLPDVVHVEGFYMMQHVPDPCPVPILLVEQNVEYALWRQRTETSGSPSTRASLKEYLLTLEAEMNAWRRSDVCAALTEDDRAMMREAVPGLDVRLVPDGVDHSPVLAGAAPYSGPEPSVMRGPHVVYVANFAYQPNVDATLFLCESILPRIRMRRPDVKVWLVGNDPPPEVVDRARRSSVIVTGRVPSITPFLDAADVVLCPLRIGGGVKVKVLEALWRGRAVVTTSVGAQGLGAGAAGALVVEDEPGRFAQAVVRLLNRPSKRRALEAAARRFSLTLPTWDDAATSLADLYYELQLRRAASLAAAVDAATSESVEG